MHKRFVAGTMAAATILSGQAIAADLPVNGPRTAAVTTAGDFYIWADASYQSIRLPKFDVGVQRDTATELFAGSFESHDPRATGAGVAGAVGYFLPPGTLPSALGTNVRLELGGSYVSATGAQSGTGPAGGTPGLLWQLLSGQMFADSGCGGICSTSSVLSTRYTAWGINMKMAGDHVLGAVTVTPSLLVLGGRAHSDQVFSQSIYQGAFNLGTYTADSAVHWTDWGARIGLEVKLALTQSLTIGLGGTAGGAGRAVSLAAADACTCAGFPGGSAVAGSAVKTPLLANAEASLAVKAGPGLTVRSFVGLNYDSAVPGISSPSRSGPVAVSSFGSPAAIKFEREAGWYAGGAATMAFAPW